MPSFALTLFWVVCVCRIQILCRAAVECPVHRELETKLNEREPPSVSGNSCNCSLSERVGIVDDQVNREIYVGFLFYSTLLRLNGRSRRRNIRGLFVLCVVDRYNAVVCWITDLYAARWWLQLLLHEVKLREQVLDFVIYMLIVLASVEQVCLALSTGVFVRVSVEYPV